MPNTTSAPSPRFEPISSSFSPDITPVIMAAHRDNYEILKILLDRGDKILKPHDVRCSCTDCVSKSSDDSLNHSRSRINAYRALASPSLIALSSKDPVLTAFELSWELRILSKLENELKVRIQGGTCQGLGFNPLVFSYNSRTVRIYIDSASLLLSYATLNWLIWFCILLSCLLKHHQTDLLPRSLAMIYLPSTEACYSTAVFREAI